jgi:hypothetical protein
VDKITAMNFRTFSPTQTLGRGELDYKVTLMLQDPLREKSLETPQ